MLFFIVASLVLLLAAEGRAQVNRCQGGDTLLQLNFDEITLINQGYVFVPTPYQGFNFITDREPNIYFSVFPALIFNSTYSGAPSYTKTASTQPNAIFTDGHGLIVTFSSTAQNQKAYTLLSFTASAVYYENMLVYVETSRNGNLISRTNVSLPLGIPTTIVVGQANIDRLYVRCPGGVTQCSHMVFDSFMICH